ncbi:uncharacterized protein LOC105423936 [Pogonomyrmex barbatus]|uniref:Uncharacterized protein LOC105423936 n=1 Tax=Pogonomyrmex barbatus TaxID=144034 RepID=A0A6I9WKG8_9HYME|nr:uncharacterized protein LOC105423936 [Pogonomyrmex barbatus]
MRSGGNAFGCCGCRHKMTGSCSNVLDIFFDDSCPSWVVLPFGTQQPTSYHPNSNGIAERAVRIVKTAINKESGTGNSPLSLGKVFIYRRTPSASTNISPAMVMFGRPLRSRLDLLKEYIANDTSNHTKTKEDDLVWTRNFSRGPKWIVGTVTETSGNAMMKVLTSQGKVARHMDQIRIRTSRQISPPIDSDSPCTPTTPVFDAPVVGSEDDMQRLFLSQPSSGPDVPSVHTPCEEQSTSFLNRPPIHIHSDEEQSTTPS